MYQVNIKQTRYFWVESRSKKKDGRERLKSWNQPKQISDYRMIDIDISYMANQSVPSFLYAGATVSGSISPSPGALLTDPCLIGGGRDPGTAGAFMLGLVFRLF